MKSKHLEADEAKSLSELQPEGFENIRGKLCICVSPCEQPRPEGRGRLECLTTVSKFEAIEDLYFFFQLSINFSLSDCRPNTQGSAGLLPNTPLIPRSPCPITLSPEQAAADRQ